MNTEQVKNIPQEVHLFEDMNSAFDSIGLNESIVFWNTIDNEMLLLAKNFIGDKYYVLLTHLV